MLKRLHIKNFTVFEEADFEFGPGLNVIVGANGTGKTHLLKIGYAVETVAELSKKNSWNVVDRGLHDSKFSWAIVMQAKLYDLFLAKQLHSLVRRGTPEKKATIQAKFGAEASPEEQSLDFSIFHNDEVAASSGVDEIPNLVTGQFAEPLFFPPKEVLSFFEGFGSVLRKFRLKFDRSFSDLFDALALPELREPPAIVREMLEPLMQRRIVLENGVFSLQPKEGQSFEINLVSEGIRKIGMLAQLLNNGSLTPETTLFWDEPEANLNPQLIRKLAEILVSLARKNFQIILATHSLFLMRELHILAQKALTPIKYFSLTGGQAGQPTTVETADELPLLPDIVALDAEMEQADIFLDVLNRDDAGI